MCNVWFVLVACVFAGGGAISADGTLFGVFNKLRPSQTLFTSFLLLRSNAGMVLLDLELDVLDEPGSGLKLLLTACPGSQLSFQ